MNAPTSGRPKICFPFVGDSLGGSHFSAVTLIRAIDAMRYEPVVVLHQQGPLSAYLDDVGVGYELLPLRRTVGRSATPLGNLLALIAVLPRLTAFIRRRDIDVVHSNDARMHLTWTLPARLAGRASLWHQRNRVSGSRLESLMLRLASRVVAISRFVAAGLPARVQARTEVVANPIAAPAPLDRAACRRALLEELAQGEDTAVIGLFGNLIGWKRPLLFVEMAAALVRLVDRPLAFVVFGEDREGLQAAMAERAATLGLSERLFFMGFRRPVSPWMAASDVMVAPAEGEPFGRTLVEAMHCGTPVVASGAGGHREVVESGRDGILVPGARPEAYAEAVAGLLADEALRDRLVQRGIETAGRYDAASHAAAVTALYDRCLGDDAAADLLLVIADLGCGGAQRVLTRLAAAWQQAGRRVTVVTLAGPERDFFALAPGIGRVALGLQAPSRGLLAALLANGRRVLALRRAIRASGAGTVISFVAGSNILSALATRGLGCRLIVSERNDPDRQSLGRPWDWLRRRVYPWADKVTANSEAAVASLRASVPEDKLAYLPNPLELPAADTAAAARDKVVLSVGRLHAQKGFDVLLDAFAASRAVETGWRLAILGEGPLRDRLAGRAAGLGIAESVDWLGLTAAPEAHYRRAGLFVLPSRYEGTPNALLEAMAQGCPAIVTESSGGARDLIEDGRNGLLVPGEDAPALAAAIDKLTGDPSLRARLAVAGRARVEAFAPARVLPLWDDLIDERDDQRSSARFEAGDMGRTREQVESG